MKLYTFDFHVPGMVYMSHMYDCKDEKDAKDKIRKAYNIKRLPSGTYIGNKRAQ